MLCLLSLSSAGRSLFMSLRLYGTEGCVVFCTLYRVAKNVDGMTRCLELLFIWLTATVRMVLSNDLAQLKDILWRECLRLDPQ